MTRGFAARVAGWDRWKRGSASVPTSVSPSGPVADTITVELFLGSAWVDITDSPVYYRDMINIGRGRADESAQVERSTCRMTINNRDGRFSPRNPTGPWYGLLGRNTPIRVSRTVDGVRRFRFHGEIPDWPTRWDISGTDVYVPIEASGILRRLGQGANPLNSALYRGIVKGATGLVGWWPLEDADNSTSMASAVPAGRPMGISHATPTLATSATFACARPLPQLNDAEFNGPVSYTATNYTQVRMLVGIPATGATATQVLVRLMTTGTAHTWDVYIPTSGTLGVSAFDPDDTNILATGALGFAVNGVPVRVSLELTQNGANVDWALRTLDTNGTVTNATGTLAAQTVGRVTNVVVSPSGGITDTTVGHVTLQNTITPMTDLLTSFQAGVGEKAGRRIERLCAEEAIEFHSIGDLDDTAAMGAQAADTLINLLRECAATDLGIVYEPRDALALGYRTRTSLYNQASTLALDYAAHQLADSLDPVDDDQAIRNDITVTRPRGSSARATLDTGTLSTQAPPAGVGRYDESVSANVQRDPDLIDQVGWRLHLGTVDEARYPTITLNLMHPSTFALSQTLRNGALVLEAGDRVTVDNPPPWMAPDQISQLAQGFTETLANGIHAMTVNCAPESPYRVGYADDLVYGRCDTDGSVLAADVSATATTLLVSTTSGPLWTTSAPEFPFDITAGGEVMTVTGITGAASPQTFTVTRSINTVTKTQTAGTDIRLTHPMILGL